MENEMKGSRMNDFDSGRDLYDDMYGDKISHSFLIALDFKEPERYFCEKNQQFRIKYIREGYDSEIIITPVPQTVGNMTPAEQVDYFSCIEELKEHHLFDYQVYVGDLNNHLTTFCYQDDLLTLLEVCKIIE